MYAINDFSLNFRNYLLEELIPALSIAQLKYNFNQCVKQSVRTLSQSAVRIQFILHIRKKNKCSSVFNLYTNFHTRRQSFQKFSKHLEATPKFQVPECLHEARPILRIHHLCHCRKNLFARKFCRPDIGYVQLL